MALVVYKVQATTGKGNTMNNNIKIKVSVTMASCITCMPSIKVYSKHFKSICSYSEILPDGSMICWNDPAKRRKVDNLIELLTIKFK